MSEPTIYVPFEMAGPMPLMYDDLSVMEADVEVGWAERLAVMSGGMTIALSEGATLTRTNSPAARFRLRLSGERARTITGARACARELTARGLVMEEEGHGGSSSGADGDD